MKACIGLIIAFNLLLYGAICPAIAQELSARLPEGGLDASAYYGSEHKRFVNRGEHLYLGRGIGKRAGLFYFLQMADQRRVKIEAPWREYMASRADLHYVSLQKKALDEQFRVGDLLYYDQSTRQAGFLLDDSWPPEGKPKRTFLLHWDFDQGRITRATVLGRKLADEYLRFIPVGVHWASNQVYVARSVAFGRGKGALREVDILKVGGDSIAVVAKIKPKKYLYRRFAFDQRTQRVFLAEYGEKHEKPKPYGYLVNLVDGDVRKTRVPFTPYGLVFGPQSEFIYMYGSQLGDLWKVKLSSLKRVKRLRVGGLGHAMGLLENNILMVVRNRGLQPVHLSPFKKGKLLPIKNYYSGFSNVSGSVAGAGWAIIKNGQMLYAVDFQTTHSSEGR